MAEELPLEGPVQTHVYPSIGRAERGRLLRKHGYGAEAVEDDGRIGFQTLIAPRLTAWLQTPHQIRPTEFGAIFLVANFALPEAASAAVVQAMRWKTMYAHLDVNRRGGLSATFTLVVAGGITEYYLRDQLWHWMRDLEQVSCQARTQLRLLTGHSVH